MADVDYPSINGIEPSYCDIRLMVGPGLRLVGVKTLNYKDNGEIPKVRGMAANDIGRTTGKNSPEGDIEMLLKEWNKLLPFLTQGGTVGYSQTIVPALQVTIDVPGDRTLTTTDSLVAVRFYGAEKSFSESTDALMVKASLSIMRILHGGIYQAIQNPADVASL